MTLAKDASPTEANNHKVVVLVHGLHQTPLVMLPMARFFAKQGYQTVLFGYHSWRDELATHTQKLAKRLDALSKEASLYLVGHSLGGLLIRHYMCTHPHRVKRAVTLGTPHLGSRIAHRMHTLAPWVLGRAYVGALDGKLCGTPTNMGCIAGNRSIGIARYLCKDSACNDTHDGTVFVSETYLKDTPHIVLPVGHTTMLFDTQVHKQVHHFLCFGCFLPTKAYTH